MQVRGTIKGIKATLSVDLEITQQLVIEFVDEAALAELRDLMQEPVIVTIETTQVKFGQKTQA